MDTNIPVNYIGDVGMPFPKNYFTLSIYIDKNLTYKQRQELFLRRAAARQSERARWADIFSPGPNASESLSRDAVLIL